MKEWKKDFPIFKNNPDLVYLDTAATAQKPFQVIDAIQKFYTEDYATVHRGVYTLSVKATEKYHDTREKVKLFLNASNDTEVIFTLNATASLNLVAFGFAQHLLHPGDTVLITSIEHHSNYLPWLKICSNKKAHLKFLMLDDLDDLDKIDQLLDSSVRFLSIPHISNVLGKKIRVEEILQLARKKGIYTCIDGAQSVGHISVDLEKMNPDFFAFSGHKMYGPTGIGILLAKKALLEQMEPLFYGGDMVDQVLPDKVIYQQAPLKFEAGTPLIAQAIGLGAAVDYLNSIGMKAIESYEKKLMHQVFEYLKQIEDCVLLYKSDSSLVSFYFKSCHPLDFTTLLDGKNIAIRSGNLCSQPTLSQFGLKSVCRLSLGVYSKLKDIEKFMAATEEILSILV